MKRLMIIYLFVSVVYLGFSQTEIFEFNNLEYKNYIYQFKKLNDNEILIYEFDSFYVNGNEYTFKVFAQDKKTEEKRLLGYWASPYNGYQFSEDKRSAIFFQEPVNSNHTYPVFLIDGNKGIVKYLLTTNFGAKTNQQLDYLLTTYPSDENTGIYKMALIDLRTLELVRMVSLELCPRIDSALVIYRSLDPEYDFRIDYPGEEGVYASSYYRIKGNLLQVIFDESCSSYEKAHPHRQIVPQEVGL